MASMIWKVESYKNSPMNFMAFYGVHDLGNSFKAIDNPSNLSMIDYKMTE